MGQTLTHGVYLPDEGERNCYDGLAANWQLLDGAVGTVAEHTTALAGKAPAVHTHTKSQITDFPAYGNTAGTICEGNDSRLSDARTPVAHTHTKSDVTDLFNSANVWTGSNTYTTAGITLKNDYVARGTIPSVNRNYVLNFTDSNNDIVGMIFQQIRSGSGSYKMTFSMNNGTTDHRINFFGFTDGSSSFIPEVTNTTDLGTSTNKWKTLNGVNPGALSLPNLSRKSSILEYITDLTGGLQYYTPLADGWICIQADNSSATNYIRCAYDDILVKANGNGQAQGLSVLIPVLAGVQIGIRVVCTTLSSAYFYHCHGNVT